MDVKKPTTIYKTNKRVLQWMLKKPTIIYETYMRVLQWMLKKTNYL
jgi:hypothetical protein